MQTSSTRKDVVSWLFRAMNRHQRPLVGILLGYVLGRSTDALFIQGLRYGDALRQVFSPSEHAWNLASWASLALMVALLGPRVLIKPRTRAMHEGMLASLLRQHSGQTVKGLAGPIWGDAVTLQTCPTIRRGWPMSAVHVHHHTSPFSLPDTYTGLYQEYLKMHYDTHRFFDDNVKVMATSNPVAFSDSPTLVLHTQETRYSVARFHHERIATIPAERARLMTALAEGFVHFPHSLCMQAIVVTQDDRVLLTERSEKVMYHPGTWSCSVEEQLAPQDLQAGPHGTVLQWCERLLWEELGLDTDAYRRENLRILSVFLESDVLNVSLCARVALDIPAGELDRRLRALPRADYEFTDWTFLRHEELLGELSNPTRSYHPASGYRMLMELIHRYGGRV